MTDLDRNARPILFNGPMVRAALDGSKTQDRRPVRFPTYGGYQSTADDWEISVEPQARLFITSRHGIVFDTQCGRPSRGMQDHLLTCPYGQPGDFLWVRETWQEFFADEVPLERRGGQPGRMGIPARPERAAVVAVVVYRADGELPPHEEYGAAIWRPSIHMPRWASRLTLRITDVRVQRVREISEDDARAEGFETDEFLDYDEWQHSVAPRDVPCTFRTLRSDFEAAWESTYPGSWERNDWVWALTFEVIKRNVDDVLREAA